MPETIWVTPTLLIGRIPAGISRAVRTETVQEALAAIEGEKTAVLPSGAIAEAEAVLRALGLSEEQVADRMSFALHGSVG